MDKVLILHRGLPGSGKSTLARFLVNEDNNEVEVCADEFFDLYNEGKFDSSLLNQAHKWCQDVASMAMSHSSPKIIVHNTFTQKWEMDFYEKVAAVYGYKVFHVVVENRHGNSSVHNVPEETILKMRDRFEVKL